MEELQYFSSEHDNLVLSVSDPIYTRRLADLMNTPKDRKLLEAVGNNLMLLAGLVCQQLEGVQLLEYKLKDAWSTSDKLRQENDQVHIALGTEKAKVASLAKERSSALEEKKQALWEKAAVLEAKRKLEEEKSKSDEQRRLAMEQAKKAKEQASELHTKVQQLEAELQV